MQPRAVRGRPATDAAVAATTVPDALWVAVIHGDVDQVGPGRRGRRHLDQFQRIIVDPASLSVVRYTERRPVRGAGQRRRHDLAGLVPPRSPPRPARRPAQAAPRRRPSATCRRPGDAPVGGGGRDRRLKSKPCRSSTSTRRTGSSPARSVPGQRTFFLQASEGAARHQRVAGEAAGGRPGRPHQRPARRAIAAGERRRPRRASRSRDNAPLDTPIEDEFRVGTMSLGWDAEPAGRHPRVPRRRRTSSSSTRRATP